MYDFTLERFLWTSFYRNSFLFLPPGPFSSQSVSDLERILVQAQKVDKNWNQTKPDVPKFKTIRQLSIESVAPAIQLLRGRYLLVGLAKSLSLYDLERSDASWDEPICIVDTVNDTEFDSKLGLSNSVEWYLNEETGSVMYAATLATKISPTEHEIEVEKILVWKIEPTAPTVISQVASIPLKLPIMYNIYVSGTFVVCHSVAYPRCHLQDSLVYHIPTGKVYHFAELTVEMASLSILFDRLLLTHQKGTITCAEIFSLPNDEDSVLLQNTHCGVLNLPPSRYRSLDHLSAFSLGNGRFVFTALNHEPDLVHHNPCVIEVNFHDDGNITSHVIAETEGSSVFKTCTNVSSRQQTTQLRIVSFAFEDEAPLVLSDLRFHQQADEHQSVDYWRDCQMPLPKSEQYPFDYVFDGYVGRICLCYAGVGVVIGDFA